ncbi:Uncharacterised protein [Vibrio cholerae]|nr:Uncharacterised protein [Vibrio cholerae]
MLVNAADSALSLSHPARNVPPLPQNPCTNRDSLRRFRELMRPVD